MLTPNKPADFENPFHLHLFERDELRAMLERHFDDVWLGGVDAAPHVKADLAARRVKANKLLRLDVLRPAAPHSARRGTSGPTPGCCRVAYKLIAREDSGGATGITADDWFVTDELDDTTLVLFAVASAGPRRGADAGRLMLAVGLTGGIGSGKSAVADLLVERGAVLIDADQVARDVVAPGGPAYQPLIDRFGTEILEADGTIDRKALAAVAFADEETPPGAQRHHPPGHRHRHDPGSGTRWPTPTTSWSWPSRS